MLELWTLQLAWAIGFSGCLSRFARDETGATAIEYAMIAAGIGATIASTVFVLGGNVRDLLFNRVVDGMGG